MHNIEYPVMQGAMAWISDGRLAAAVPGTTILPPGYAAGFLCGQPSYARRVL